jgi:hypothetical protein
MEIALAYFNFFPYKGRSLIKAQLSLRLIKHRIKIYVVEEVYLHEFLNVDIDGGK